MYSPAREPNSLRSPSRLLLKSRTPHWARLPRLIRALRPVRLHATPVEKTTPFLVRASARTPNPNHHLPLAPSNISRATSAGSRRPAFDSFHWNAGDTTEPRSWMFQVGAACSLSSNTPAASLKPAPGTNSAVALSARSPARHSPNTPLQPGDHAAQRRRNADPQGCGALCSPPL